MDVHRIKHRRRAHYDPVCKPAALRRPLELGQYTSIDYTQTLADHQLLASVGSVGDAYDNALAESFVDSFKTELIADRVWRTRSQLELAVVEYIGWYNHSRLHESLGYLPPAESEHRWHAANAEKAANSDKHSPPPPPRRALEAITAPRLLALGAERVEAGMIATAPVATALIVDALSAPETRPSPTPNEGAITVIKRRVETT
jgi:hypothetical protein